jgi:hypothetical protein
MFIRDIKGCRDIVAVDKTVLRELLHPERTEGDFRYSLAHATVRAGERPI